MLRTSRAFLLALLLMAIALSAAAALSESPLTLPVTPNADTVASDGTLWILTDKGKLGKLPPGGSYTEVAAPWGTDQFNIPYAQSLTIGIDDNVWVLGFNGHVARVTPSGTMSDFTLASANILSSSIVSGADGALWFFNRLAPGPGTIGSPNWKMTRIDIYGQSTTYDLGISNDNLAGLVSGGDGSLWFIDQTKNQVVRYSLVTNAVAGTFAIPSPAGDGDGQTTLGWDGNVWFTHAASIDRVRPDGTITEFKVPSGGATSAIAMVGDGSIWFTEPTSGKLGQLDLSSVTSGGPAKITETDGVGAGAYGLIVLPSRTTPPTSPGQALPQLALIPQPCKVKVQKHISVPPPPHDVWVEETQLDCYHQGNLSALGHSSGAGAFLAAAVVIGGTVLPDELTPTPLSAHSSAQNVSITAVLNLTAPPGVTISGITADPSMTTSFNGLSATLTKNATSASNAFSAVVSLTPPAAGQTTRITGAVTVSASLPDADPTNHVAFMSMDLAALQSRKGLSPNTPNVVITPVKRGK